MPICGARVSRVFCSSYHALIELEPGAKSMKPFSGFNRHGKIERLVNAGLLAPGDDREVAVANCIYLLAGSLGDSWRALGREAAAGMVLLALAKDSALENHLNDCGWKLVSGCIDSLPSPTRSLHPRTLREILARRAASGSPALPATA
jgi:hypothetical protein